MRIAIILCALLCAAGIAARADIQQDVINRDPSPGGGGGGGTVTVGESDGSPSVSDASTISFDQSQGFTVTDEGGGEAEVGLSLGAALVLYDDTNDGYPAGVVNVEDALDALVNEPVGGPNSEDSLIPFENLKNVPEFRKTLYQLRPQGYEPPASSFATVNARNAHPTLRFGGNVCAVWSFVMPNTYGGNGVTVDIWYVSTETSNDTDWDGSWERIATSQDVDSDSFASAISADNNGNNATSGIATKVSIAFTDGAEMDSCAADELCRFRLCRDDTSDTGGANTIDFLGGQIRETP
ncbi:MAG: hypothetical protein KJ002_02000 [Candidatus Dadabacteria bacterium]|nr:hypothetical protein [Candidatus Dadabacteria bacterium]